MIFRPKKEANLEGYNFLQMENKTYLQLSRENKFRRVVLKINGQQNDNYH